MCTPRPPRISIVEVDVYTRARMFCYFVPVLVCSDPAHGFLVSGDPAHAGVDVPICPHKCSVCLLLGPHGLILLCFLVRGQNGEA